MGFFTEDEIGSLRITNMVLHVVGGGDFEPQQAREVEHEEFFIARIRDTDVDAVFAFDPNSQTKAQLERIASGEDEFEFGAQNLAREFARLHLGHVRDGAFFIFELACDRPSVRFYSLIKYDYNEAIEQASGEQGGLLRRIVHAFIADKKAIQKSAIVRVVNNVAEAALSARDRMKRQPDIGDYFAAFLHATRIRSDEELNRQMVDAIRGILEKCQDLLPDRNVPRAFQRTKDILRDRQEITEDAISDAVLAAAGNPEDEDSRARLQAHVQRRVRHAKLEGLVFPPHPGVLRRPPMRRVKTAEGVTVLYPGDAEGVSVRRVPRAAGGETITIETEQVTEDRVVSDRARNAA